MSHHKPDAGTVQSLKDVANKLRISSIEMTNASNSGHPTSCCSAAEIMSVLFFNVMKYKVSDPRCPASDRFVLSKGIINVASVSTSISTLVILDCNFCKIFCVYQML